MAHRLVAIWPLPTSFTSPLSTFSQSLSPSCHVAGYPGFRSGDRPVARFYFWCPGNLSEAQHPIHNSCIFMPPLAVKIMIVQLQRTQSATISIIGKTSGKKLLAAKPDLRRTGVLEDGISSVLSGCQQRTWDWIANSSASSWRLKTCKPGSITEKSNQFSWES